MKQLSHITDAEWQIMKVIWKYNPLYSSEIIDYLKANTSWSPKTIHTLISRLVNKGIVEAKKDGTFYKYYPLISEEEYRRYKTKSFIQKIYDGSFQLLIKNFIKDEKLTPEEIEELQSIINELKN